MQININFNERPIGPYIEGLIREDWNNPKRIMGAPSGRCEIITDLLNSAHNVLKIKYPKEKVGHK